MSFNQDSGYIPPTFDELMDFVRIGINTQFATDFTVDNFVGTNWYKYFYQLVQKVMENEIKTSEIFLKLQQYIATTNEKIQRPSVSHPGIIDSFELNGFIASIKPLIDVDAGKLSVCVDTDSTLPTYAATKLQICTLLKDYVAAGIVTQGTEISTIVLSNGQSFDFKFFLPNKIPVLLRATITKSDNTSLLIPTDEQIRQKIFDNINVRYRLGWDFAPQRYYEVLEDAPWAATILLEWSSNAGVLWQSTVYQGAFNDLFTFGLGNIAVVVS